MFGAVKRLIRRGMEAVAPQTTAGLVAARARAHSHRLVREWGLLGLNEKLLARLGTAVRSGPFRGMTLTPMTHREHLGPFLLGTYERPLHPWLDLVASRRFSQLLDVGAKFGYYAVGLARRSPGTPVLAFDTDRWARAATREMAAANNTPHVSVAGFCSPTWLDRDLLPESFILTDCEGYEGELFTQARSPSLASATLLVELHDELVPGVGAAVCERFAHTHTAETVLHTPSSPPPELLEFLTPDEAEAAVREFRGRQEWVLFTPVAR